jgi:hypothetical protein
MPRETIGQTLDLDVTFNEDRSRLRTGHGAKNMAVIRHFALNLVRPIGRQALNQAASQSAPVGMRNTCSTFWGRSDVNLDSLPWRVGHVQRRSSNWRRLRPLWAEGPRGPNFMLLWSFSEANTNYGAEAARYCITCAAYARVKLGPTLRAQLAQRNRLLNTFRLTDVNESQLASFVAVASHAS